MPTLHLSAPLVSQPELRNLRTVATVLVVVPDSLLYGPDPQECPHIGPVKTFKINMETLTVGSERVLPEKVINDNVNTP